LEGTIIRVTLLFLFCIGLFQFNCSSDDVKNDNVFVIATYDDVRDWDPATAFSLEIFPMSNMYEPLLWYDAGVKPGRFVPALATSYSKSEDGLVWVFNLRENVFFHDGTRFDAETVKLVVERNKRLNGGASYIWSSVSKIIINSPHQITFTLSSPVPFDKIVSSQYGAWMYSPLIDSVSKDSLNHGFGSGTGPYQLKKWARNKYILLDKFDNYWGGWKKRDHYNSVLIQIATESSTRFQMIKNGIADYAVLIPNQLIETLENSSEVSVSYHPSWVNEFYLLNTKKHPTNNLWFRRAIASSIDRSILSKYVYKNTAVESRGLIPQSIPLFVAPDSLIDFSLDIAKNYLKKSGLDLTSLKTDLSYVSTYEQYRLTAFMLLDNLRKIGVNLDLRPGLWSTNWDKAKNLDTAPNIISMAWWPTVSSPSDWLFALYNSQENPLFNLSYYSNSVVDSLTRKAWELETTEPKVAQDLYKKIQNILIDDCVVIPAVDVNVASVRKRNISGLRSNPAYSTIFVYNLSKN
tara:strand:- start:731 stop:2290 length:1560 start_codon:yes stop_codon:yes gene_type:complete